MKKYLRLIAVVLFISACSKQDNLPTFPVSIKSVVKDAGLIKFKAIPLADNQLKMSFMKDDNKTPAKIVLKVDTTTLATMPVTDDGAGYVSATINYAFKPGQTYNFLVQSSVGKDTTYVYKIPAYTHAYIKKYNYQKILPLKYNQGPQGFDLSPSRRYMFIQDDINNVIQTSRIDLQTLAVDKVNFDLTGSPIRAVSDHELLAFGNKSTLNVPAYTDPGNEADVLARYDMNTNQSSFVDIVSRSYGRISRVINNHVMVTNPIFSAKTASLIDLSNLSDIKYSLNDVDFRFIDQYSFGHLLYKSMVVNTTNGSFSTPINLNDDSGLLDIDDATGYAFVTSIQKSANNDLTTGFTIYKNKTLIYQSDFKYARSSSFPIIYNIKNDVVTFYQYFGFDTQANIDGYYTLNLKTKELKLIDANSSSYVGTDYQLKDGSVFSVRLDGVYKLTAAN